MITIGPCRRPQNKRQTLYPLLSETVVRSIWLIFRFLSSPLPLIRYIQRGTHFPDVKRLFFIFLCFLRHIFFSSFSSASVGMCLAIVFTPSTATVTALPPLSPSRLHNRSSVCGGEKKLRMLSFRVDNTRSLGLVELVHQPASQHTAHSPSESDGNTAG